MQTFPNLSIRPHCIHAYMPAAWYCSWRCYCEPRCMVQCEKDRRKRSDLIKSHQERFYCRSEDLMENFGVHGAPARLTWTTWDKKRCVDPSGSINSNLIPVQHIWYFCIWSMLTSHRYTCTFGTIATKACVQTRCRFCFGQDWVDSRWPQKTATSIISIISAV